MSNPKTALQPDERINVHINYTLMALGVLTALPVLIALPLAWWFRSQATEPLVVRHLTWQIRTLCINVLIWFAGLALTVVLIGFVILACNQLWLIYRVVRGWVCLAHGRIP